MKRKGRVISTGLVSTLTFIMLSVSAIAADPREWTGPSLNPYDGIEAELNFGTTGYVVSEEGGRTGKRDSVYLEEGDYIKVSDVNFEEGLSKLTMNAKGDEASIIEVRSEKEDGRKLGTIRISKDSDFKNYSCSAEDIGGKNTVYFICAKGTCYVDAWKAEKKKPTKDEIQAPPAVLNPYETVETEAMENGGGFIEDGVEYSPIGERKTLIARNVMFSKGLKGFEFTARINWDDATFQVRLDDPESEPITYGLIRSKSFVTVQLSAPQITGMHDLYITTKDRLDIDSWRAIPNPPMPSVPPVPPVTPEEKNDPETPVEIQQPETPVEIQESETTEEPGVEEEAPKLKVVGYANPCGNNLQINIEVTNNTDETIPTWKIVLKKQEINIVQNWCANLEEVGDVYELTPYSWNSKLEPGQSTEFGIVVEGKIADPLTMQYTIE